MLSNNACLHKTAYISTYGLPYHFIQHSQGGAFSCTIPPESIEFVCPTTNRKTKARMHFMFNELKS